MPIELSIRSTLQHGGDEVIRYSIAVISDKFSAATLTWANVDEHLELANALTGFPSSAASAISYQFGSSGVGFCKLDFVCLDGSGHIGIWAYIEGAYPIGQTKRYESATVFLRTEASAIDSFVSALRKFTPGAENQASL